MKLSTIQRRYYDLIIAEKKDGTIIEGAIARDGLLFLFEHADIAELLAQYPTTYHPRRPVWYFNESRDREIAELTPEDWVAVNPQFVRSHIVAYA